ncbi:MULTISPECIES: helicase-exonuclease AddAB subunit AddA [unclassified Bacillus (in: firmicutes)]|uniref:helicase-exonuclease AddAB subunit AddA n=1 Tax=unclassified Bacillus (in: firmicutes) TaxID=185979 RepID=UPI0008EC83EB|nr:MULTISPECIES: helicase-exonuclease AddAB subunit AddA [unclassified Bacillus (in: firmicutes)]SFA79496.1 DNA helicase/exodeoxyribonuclease V, subunit A [Bacillus sp. UNCCL13]SFQ69522.1 DNA helicase/exodeoxyribonuclease V, subunit A [Bacillus sp. cl95]
MSKLNIPPKPENVTWTDDQWKAIMAKDQDILVAAAAGSGKTAVLVERMIQKIIAEEDPINVDELLVVTFTNASAAEMRHRIGEALEKAIDKDPGSQHLRTQLSLLNRASISTLHSFCLEVIRKYYYLIDIDPGFRIADQIEGQLLRDEVMDELFEDEYGKQGNEDFFKLVDTFSNDRSDTGLQDIVAKIYEFAMSNPMPAKYLDSIVNMYKVDPNQSLEDLPFIQTLLYDIELQLQGAKQLLERGLELTRLPGGPAPRAENFEDDLKIVDTLFMAKNDSWMTLYHAMQTWSFSRAKPCKKGMFDEGLTEKAKELRDKAKKLLETMKTELFTRKPESFLCDMNEMKPLIQTLVGLVQSFADRFDQLKREKGLVDFSDLEHSSLAILANRPSEDGQLLPSEAAIAYRDHFKEVLVDEYQDTNMVQETILKLVSKQGENGNLFMVGDVKQSIYRFRLAEPNLFLGKYNLFGNGESGPGLKIDLAKNFRSRFEVLEGTNFLFKQLMGVKVGEIEYDEPAELKKGAPYPEDKSYPIELMLIDQAQGSSSESEDDAEEASSDATEFDKDDLKQSQLEARAMALKIKRMIAEQKEVYNAKTNTGRPVMYRDIVILLRSMTWAPQIMEEFKQQGIPIYANLSTGYFEATEVAIMMSLLRVIDNPYQDIPLVSVLRSPIVGLDEEELAKIRIHHKKNTFFEALSDFCSRVPKEETEGAYEKVRYFYEKLKDWRSQARQGALSELIWQLYRDTRFYDFAGGLPGGKQRQANLRALYDRARQYEETSFRGLFRFLRFIERIMDRGDDLGAARALGEQEDVVRMMTIHSSKGLEFPVVFIAGLSRQFNTIDIKKPYLLDKEYGFAAKYVNPEKRIAYPSLPQLAFKRKKKMEMLAEEMRVLYVALTRAKEKLYLLASVKDLRKKLEQWADTSQNMDWLLKDYERAAANSYFDWVGPALMRHRDAGELLVDSGDHSHGYKEIYNHRSAWDIKVLSAADLRVEEELAEQEMENLLDFVKEGQFVPIHSSLKEEISDRLTWTYENKDAATHRSKQSVSEMKRHREISDEQSGTDLLRKFRKPLLNRPRFIQEKALTPAERGTALHMVMQHIDLAKPIDAGSFQQQVTDMVARELLTEEQAEVIDVALIEQFFETEIGKRMLAAKSVKREIPFSLALPARSIYPDWRGAEESIFIQGVVDCLFEDEEGLVLLDYKTDAITERYKGGFEQAKRIMEDRYRMQIELYAKAVEQIWKKPIQHRYLFFFDGANILKIE